MLTALHVLSCPPMFTNTTASPKCSPPSFVTDSFICRHKHHHYYQTNHFHYIIVLFSFKLDFIIFYRSQEILFEEVHFLGCKFTFLPFLQIFFHFILWKETTHLLLNVTCNGCKLVIRYGIRMYHCQVSCNQQFLQIICPVMERHVLNI